MLKKLTILFIFSLLISSLLIYKFNSKTYDAIITNIKDEVITIEHTETKNKITVKSKFNLKLNDNIKITYQDKSIKLQDFASKNTTITAKITYSKKLTNIKKIKIESISGSKIITYLKNEIKENDIEKIINTIKKINGIENIELKTKDEWKKELENNNENFKNIFDTINSNPLKDTLTITTKENSNLKNIIKELEKINEINDIQY